MRVTEWLAYVRPLHPADHAAVIADERVRPMFAHFTPRNGAVALILLCSILSGCGGSPPPSESKAGRMVYVDTATMQALVHEVATSFPAVHPKTGKPTLRPALFCPTCKKWYPAPDLEQINRVRGAGLCPKDKTALTTDGPWPDGSK